MFTKYVYRIPPPCSYLRVVRLCWYVGDKYLRDFKAPAGVSFSPRVLEGILTLAEFLVAEARTLESGGDQAKKEAKEHIPADRVKDAPAVARELRWRVKQALGYSSEDEGSGSGRRSGAGSKRRRVEEEEEPSLFRNFKPRPWDAIVSKKEDAQTSDVKMPPVESGDDDWAQRWTGDEIGGEVDGKVSRRRELVTKVRRTGSEKIERQRIERLVEEWTAV